MLKYNDIISKLAEYQKVRILTEAGNLSGKDMKILGIPKVKAAAMKDYGRDIYPNVTALAHAWDEELWHKVATEKTEMMLADGVNFVIAPGAKIKISPYRREVGEDPYHASVISGAHLRAAAECGARAAASGYYLTDSDVRWMDKEPSDRVINEFILSPFKRAARLGKSSAVVSDLREPCGAYRDSCRNLQRIISGEVEFTVCERATDENTVELISKNVVCLSGSANALEGAINRYKRIMRSVEIGEGVTLDQLAAEEAEFTASSPESVDAAVDKALEFIFACQSEPKEERSAGPDPVLSLRAVRESAVLLKNKNAALPLLNPGRIAVIGDIVLDELDGARRVDAFNKRLEAAGYRISGTASGYDMSLPVANSRVSEAVSLALNSDTVILFLGFGYEAEKRVPKTETLSLPANQLYLADELSTLGKRVIAVISAGHAPDIAFTRKFDAVLMLPLEVRDSMNALADILTGEYNPSGKLAYTLYAGSDAAFAKNNAYRNKYGMKAGPFVGYRYYDTAGMCIGYPFGHGLSYTEFKYSELKIEGKNISFTLENIGERKGAEVAQIYLGIKDSALIRPKKELVRFVKVELFPGESKRISTTVEIPEAYSDGKFLAEGGEYTVSVGGSVDDIRLTDRVMLPGETLKPDGERAVDYLQTVSNVKDDNYTLEANYSFMKKSVKNILFGIGALALAISVAVFNSISEESSLFIGAVAGILAACAIIFFVMEAVERSRAYNDEREEINIANKEHFAGAEELTMFSTDAMFSEEFDVDESESFVANTFVSDVVEENYLEFVDVNFRIANAAGELKSFLSSRGYKAPDNFVEGLLSSIATNGLIVTGGMASEDFNAFVKLISEYFGGEAFVDVADKNAQNASALFDYDYHGDHAKKNLLLALDSARDHVDRVVFAALDKAPAASLDTYFTPFMRYLHSPKAKNQIILPDANGSNLTYNIAPNLRFIVNLGANESLDMLPSFIASLACVHDIRLVSCQPTELSGARTVNRYQLDYMVEKECGAEISEETWKKIDKLEKYVSKISEYSIGNKLWLGFEKQLALLISEGLDISDAIDTAVSARLLPSMSVALKDKISDDDQTLTESLEFIFGEEKIAVGKAMLSSLVFTPAEVVEEAPAEESAPTEDNNAIASSSFGALFASSPVNNMTTPEPAYDTPAAEPAEIPAASDEVTDAVAADEQPEIAEEAIETEEATEGEPIEETVEAEENTEAEEIIEADEATEPAEEPTEADEAPEGDGESAAEPEESPKNGGSFFSGSFMDMFNK